VFKFSVLPSKTCDYVFKADSIFFGNQRLFLSLGFFYAFRAFRVTKGTLENKPCIRNALGKGIKAYKTEKRKRLTAKL
jgi:hypothetical protein